MMRKLFFSVFFFTFGSSLMAADISGAWYFERTLPNGRKTEAYYVFKADGKKFTGRSIGTSGRQEIANGLVDGDQVTFDLKSSQPASKPAPYKGTLNGEELRFALAQAPQGRPAPETILHRISTSTEFNPPPSLAALMAQHKPFPPFKPIKPNGLAKTPPMGWNSWNKFRDKIDDKTVREITDAMVSSGMKDAGYLYVNIDDTWEGKRDAQGNITTNEKFPDMKALADYVHSKGLKIGIYSGPGRATCQRFEASYLHEEQDAKTFAAWGIDYLKYDWCNASDVYDPEEMPSAYQKMALALRETGRPVVYSLCQYGWLDVGKWGADAGGNLWRTTDDIRDGWNFMSNIGFVQQNGREIYAGPGHWNDPDMLEIGNGGMSATEYRTHMSLWCMLAAPLLAGNDLRSMTTETINILTNKEVVAIDQDKLGKQGVRAKQDGELEIWKKPLADGVAIALFNRSAATAKMSVRWTELGIKNKPKVRDLWAHTDVTAPTEYSAEVPSHGVVMLRIK
ncbi:MAG: glycoside hydrolase family 27 protein [Acidobacteriota bacterium]|jgi:alpha-galactosidase